MAERTVPAPQRQAEVAQEGTRAPERYVEPPVDIYETAEGLVVMADLPGVRRDDLSIEVKDDILTIQARAQNIAPGNLLHREFELACFYRQFQLSDKVDVTKIAAEFRHGVLKLNLPKAEEMKPRRIEVKVG